MGVLLGLALAAGMALSRGGEDMISGIGMVRYVPISGGFYGIEADDGRQYLPLDLDAAFKVDGLRVRFTVRPEPDMVTIYMWGTPAYVVAVEAVEDDLAALVAGNTAFALALYEEVRSQPGNLIFSPVSISAALGMTYAGARGTTAAEMAEVLRFDLPDDRLHAAFETLLGTLDGEDRPYELAVANALWGQRGYGFLSSFLDLARRHYGAGLEEVDFAGDPEAAREAINAWVAERTRDRIEELLAPGDVDPLTVMVLVNAIYLRADWALPFDPERTAEADFHLSDDEVVQVPTMVRRAWLRYAQLDDVQILELPYEGGDLSMVVLLPAREMGIGELEAQLSSDRLGRWLGALESRYVQVHLPRFTARTELRLAEVLSEMGMPTAFALGADFSGLIEDKDLYLDEVIHQAFVEVQEEGTEAAAATAVVVAERAAIEPDPEVFRADRPFMFLLRHRGTGTVLFLGRVCDPR